MSRARKGVNTRFTKQQKADWRAYEEVRQRGNWNMFTNARDAADEAGLDIGDYWFVLKNYSELKKAMTGDLTR